MVGVKSESVKSGGEPLERYSIFVADLRAFLRFACGRPFVHWSIPQFFFFFFRAVFFYRRFICAARADPIGGSFHDDCAAEIAPRTTTTLLYWIIRDGEFRAIRTLAPPLFPPESCDPRLSRRDRKRLGFLRASPSPPQPVFALISRGNLISATCNIQFYL